MNSAEDPKAPVTAGEHLLGRFVGDENGPTLIVFGGVHGNEASGVNAINRIIPKLTEIKPKLKGRVFFIAGNTRALTKSLRYIDSDLNRHWTAENLAKQTSEVSEDKELKELLQILDEILNSARNEVFVMDLHSTSADGLPFATLGDTLRNRAFAQKFPITILLGIEEQLDGTILEYLNNLGTITLGFEAGQHFAASTVDNHEALIWLGLVNSGVLKRTDSNYAEYFETLQKASGRGRIVEIFHREVVDPERDGFQMKVGYENFQSIRAGEVLAQNTLGDIAANQSGMILMPLYQKQGNDGFFLAREVAPFWLWLSKKLRNSAAADLIGILPGVRKDRNDGTFNVDTRIARLFPLQLFHLLGFRKRRWKENKLVVSRRLHDTKSPFVK